MFLVLFRGSGLHKGAKQSILISDVLWTSLCSRAKTLALFGTPPSGNTHVENTIELAGKRYRGQQEKSKNDL